MDGWGKSMLVDAINCDHSKIINFTNIEKFAKKLVRDIDMVAYGKPEIHHFGSGDKQGYTLIQLIETSNIVAHFSEDTDSMFLDVFSCKDFDPQIVLRCVEDFFGGYSFTSFYKILDRGLDF